MENNYYKLLNFVTKLSQPKLKEVALETLSSIDENKGNTALDIFENGIDNAEAIIAIEARRLLSQISKEDLDLTQILKGTQELLLDDKDVISKAFKATRGHAGRMSRMTSMPLRSIYNKMKRYELDRRKYNFRDTY